MGFDGGGKNCFGWYNLPVDYVVHCRFMDSVSCYGKRPIHNINMTQAKRIIFGGYFTKTF